MSTLPIPLLELHTDWSTLVSLLRSRATESPGPAPYTFLSDEAQQETTLDYAGMDAAARALAARIQQAGIARGEDRPRALVVFPAGADFLPAFFAVLYAGAIAIPTHYPHSRRPLDQIAGIVKDCDATIGVTTPEMQPILAVALPHMTWFCLTSDLTDAAQWQNPHLTADDVAYLQYTSGSTSNPKGVVLLHRQVLANCEMLRRHFEILPQSRILNWLPHFHDMGLVLGLIETMYAGCRSFNLSPMEFVQRPISWLAAMRRYSITHIGAPDFAYETCATLPPARLEGLDLSSVVFASDGAEPVRAETLRRFTERFAPHGFDPAALSPGYGLAENTLIVTSSRPHRLPVIRTFASHALRDGHFQLATAGEEGTTLVSSGDLQADTRILIVSDTHEIQPEGHSGEIWVSGPSVAQGYWNNPAASQKFTATLPQYANERFLRTGDLGMVYEDELFVLGRADDMIVLRGQNYYPEDIEPHIETCHPALQSHGSIVFGFESAGEQRLGVAVELQRTALRTADFDAIRRTILAAVSDARQLELSACILLKPRSLPRTRSGKKQRQLCRRRFLDQALPALDLWLAPMLHHTWQTSSAEPPLGSLQDDETPATWLAHWVAARTGCDPQTIAPADRLGSYGLDSVASLQLTDAIERRFHIRLASTAIWDHPTFAELATHITELEATTTIDALTPTLDELALLAQLDHLSDAEVEQLLQQIPAESQR